MSGGEGAEVAGLRTLKGATVIFNGGNSILSCVLLDASKTSARLKLDEGSPELPDRFLLIAGQGKARQDWAARVTWRSSDELGVVFEWDPAEAAKNRRAAIVCALTLSVGGWGAGYVGASSIST